MTMFSTRCPACTHRVQVRIGDSEFIAEGDEQVVDAQYDKFLAALGKKKRQSQLTEEQLLVLFDLKDGTLRLKKKRFGPAAEAILLLIYGHHAVLGQDDVLASELLESVDVERIDRPLERYRNYVVRSGEKRGAKYALNGEGFAYAEQLAKQRLETKREAR